MLKQVAAKGESVKIPQGAFMKEVHSDKYFPVSGEIVPIRSKAVSYTHLLVFSTNSEGPSRRQAHPAD